MDFKRFATDNARAEFTGLRKLALKRDPNAPIGFEAALHLDCPCGATVNVSVLSPDVNICPGCGAKYDSLGWKL